MTKTATESSALKIYITGLWGFQSEIEDRAHLQATTKTARILVMFYTLSHISGICIQLL